MNPGREVCNGLVRNKGVVLLKEIESSERRQPFKGVIPSLRGVY